MTSPTISDAVLASVPRRRSRRKIVVLKFGGTTVGSPRKQGRIRLARQQMAELISQGNHVVPVFSAYRRGRSGSQYKLSVTDLLLRHRTLVADHDTFETGIEALRNDLWNAHFELLSDLEINECSIADELKQDIDYLMSNITMSCTAFEQLPSINDAIVTAGERLSCKIMSAYLNQKFASAEFPKKTAPVTALELGIYTNNSFGSAIIDWARAVDHAREVIVGQYLDRDIMPIVTGFDGIYDPNNEFKELMQSSRKSIQLKNRCAGVFRTSLGRGGSDLTAAFLGLALSAEYVGFCKETPGVLTGDDLLVGNSAQTVAELDYDLATEAGNVYSRAVEPVRAVNIPIHIFDPAEPDKRTVISDVKLPPGLYVIERPIESVNIHSRSIADQPGALLNFLQIFADRNVNVEEIRHQRSGTDCIVCGDEDSIQELINELNARGFQSEAHFTWYLRVIGNITERLSAQFNEFMDEFEPLTLAAYQIGTKVVTATVARNRAGDQIEEMRRIERIVGRIHNELVVKNSDSDTANSGKSLVL